MTALSFAVLPLGQDWRARRNSGIDPSSGALGGSHPPCSPEPPLPPNEGVLGHDHGHKESLISFRCISREQLASARYGLYEIDPRGALAIVESKPAPGRRKMLELSYFVRSRAFAGMLPGVRAYCSDWLEALTSRPKLRLVVDNTR